MVSIYFLLDSWAFPSRSLVSFSSGSKCDLFLEYANILKAKVRHNYFYQAPQSNDQVLVDGVKQLRVKDLLQIHIHHLRGEG